MTNINYKVVVIYSFVNEAEEHIKEFNDFISALKFNNEITSKYRKSKNKTLQEVRYGGLKIVDGKKEYVELNSIIDKI